LYGTTQQGGTGYGTAFGITTNGMFTCQAVFSGTNGENVIAGLAQGSDGNLYGTTIDGGQTGYGTIFEMTTSGTLRSLHSFRVVPPFTIVGLYPNGGLVQ